MSEAEISRCLTVHAALDCSLIEMLWWHFRRGIAHFQPFSTCNVLLKASRNSLSDTSSKGIRVPAVELTLPEGFRLPMHVFLLAHSCKE